MRNTPQPKLLTGKPTLTPVSKRDEAVVLNYLEDVYAKVDEIQAIQCEGFDQEPAVTDWELSARAWKFAFEVLAVFASLMVLGSFVSAHFRSGWYGLGFSVVSLVLISACWACWGGE